MASLLDGVLIEFAVASPGESRKAGKDALLVGWECDDRTHLWLEAARLAYKGWHIDVLAEPIDSPRPELFPGQKFSSGPVKRLRLVNRSSSTTGVNRVSPFRSITDVKGPTVNRQRGIFAFWRYDRGILKDALHQYPCHIVAHLSPATFRVYCAAVTDCTFHAPFSLAMQSTTTCSCFLPNAM